MYEEVTEDPIDDQDDLFYNLYTTSDVCERFRNEALQKKNVTFF